MDVAPTCRSERSLRVLTDLHSDEIVSPQAGSTAPRQLLARLLEGNRCASDVVATTRSKRRLRTLPARLPGVSPIEDARVPQTLLELCRMKHSEGCEASPWEPVPWQVKAESLGDRWGTSDSLRSTLLHSLPLASRSMSFTRTLR